MDGKTVEEEVQLAAKHFGLITVSKVERGSALAQELMQFVEKCSWYAVKEVGVHRLGVYVCRS